MIYLAVALGMMFYDQVIKKNRNAGETLQKLLRALSRHNYSCECDIDIIDILNKN